ncbi:MAG: carboxypeptidase-like regulatory domain-containing protein [Flavobacteriaceae bacterium]|nr:carboxypeptidase-like regulatory domain-containing protein [Flavobacteriaceae bacterium]
MKAKSKFKRSGLVYVILFSLMFVGYFKSIDSISAQVNQISDFTEYSGKIVDGKTKKPLEFASIVLNNTNISTISNIDGEFLLKVPKNLTDNNITITYLGFNNKVILLSKFDSDNYIIKLEESFENLPNVNLTTKDPIIIVNKMMDNRQKNYFNEPVIMKAFYRESIKKKKSYASLSEAVIDIYKYPYKSNNKDYVKLYRARKSTDYRKIDTLVIKLQGGPYNNLNMDMIKNHNMFFASDIFEIYNFTFDKVISMNNKTVYVINFIQNSTVIEPFYQGKLYIEAQSYALIKAVFSLNLENLQKASKYFVKKKPAKADVIPIKTKYIVDYRLNKGKWYFGYSRIELSFKIDWNKKLFNSQYHLTIEMAVTDWEVNKNNIGLKNKEKLKTNIILNDKATGFSDPEFWGEYNVIEPDKSIENAIKKIQRQLKK